MSTIAENSLRKFRRENFYPYHIRIRSEENGVDPDDGNSWMCSACTLPIFSTPFNTKHGQFLHDQCANLPKKLMDNAFHPGVPLVLKENWDSSSSQYSCDECSKKCGSMFYQCLEPYCDFRLDLLCSLQIKILHRSHEHRLTAVIRGRAAFSCSACGTQHEGLSSPSYLCTACGFWIHKDCASSPNAIRLVQPQQHRHSLFLTYNINVAATSAGYCKCAVCGKIISRGLGAYICYKCKYYAHIRCATWDPRCFEPVLIRDAKLADLLHLPMPDESTSIVRYMLENTDVREEEEEYGDEEVGNPKYRYDQRLHKHPLIFHDEEDSGEADDEDDDDGTGHSSSRVCNACVQFISPPFYSCSQCPDFLLHASCFNLPAEIKHPFHPYHTLSLFTKAPNKYYDVGFFCDGCGIVCSGFAYCCKTCRDCNMDVLCALMPASITHASHGKTHILYMSSHYYSGTCSCCNLYFAGRMSYECGNCRHLKLHARCALLPTTITHKFDAHPLNLTTSTRLTLLTTDDEHDDTQQICEVCEEDIDKRCWNYSCNDCEQWLHINCIPFLDRRVSRVKFGGSVGFKCHDCPLTGVRESTLAGYRCDCCKSKFRYENYKKEHRAYECSKCCYKIHETCAMSEIP
ncbi:uncharacterized protein LOC130985073 [Salvia miltiorrhiza]|uniref:uncharacterized protein LOC130985073 n=1 Tax=Salvia miltiorrhiza TaxID=226208 RepID=UPI0025AB8A5B|nr:uncharacterized protein LOC130985073 [Salvia miltiorrhiza]